MMTRLPDPECKYGYTDNQIRLILGDKYNSFARWMFGQTMSICSGMEYDHDTRKMLPSGCGRAHGTIVYPWDLERYLERKPIID